MPRSRLAAFGVAAIAVVACRQIAGLGDRTVDPTKVCGIAYDEACQSCANASCCGQVAACASSPSCSTLETCLAGCAGEPGCRTRCILANPVEDDPLTPGALDACLATSCASACNLPCGALSHLVEPDASAACQAAMIQQSCSKMERCATSVDCQRYVHCREGCVTGDCIGACTTQDEAGADAYYYLDGLLQSAQACEYGDNWACVGHVQWPAVRTPAVTVTIAFTDIVTQDPIVGMQVSLCPELSVTCDPTVGPVQTTDGQGSVSLTWPTSSVTGEGLGPESYASLSSTGYYPTKLFWGFPLSLEHGALGTPIPVLSQLAWAAQPQTYATDPSMGTIAALVVDCMGNQSGGVTIQAAPEGGDAGAMRVVYADGSKHLDPTLTSTTAKVGVAFIFNVPPGTVALTATPSGLGGPSSKRVPVYVWPATLTEVGLQPTPLE